MLPVEVSRALAALRCLPCLLGSFVATEEGARREAVGRPLGIIEDLLAACSTPSGVAAAAVNRTSSAIQGGQKSDAPAGGSSERRRKRGKGEGGKAASAGGGRDGGEGLAGEPTGYGKGNTHDEVVVLRAYALEAGVGLCCLLPADDQGGMTGRGETLERLLRWHER